MVKLPKKKSTVNSSQSTADDTGQTRDDLVKQMMNQAPPEPAAVPPMPIPQPASVSLGKEREMFAEQDADALEEVRKELEIPPEIKESGVEVREEKAEISEELQKMGVTHSDVVQPITSGSVTLPIADDKIVTGFGAPIVSSLRWLVEWCRKQLKKVHIKLKNVHGRITRVITH